MSEYDMAPSPEEIAVASGLPYPNPVPYKHITFALVAWNEGHRLPALLRHVRPYFETLAVAVQESTDDTLAIATELADIVVTDAHRGYGDATFGPLLLPQVKSAWTLKCDADEWPTHDLLASLSSATWFAEQNGRVGFWIPFRSAVDGIEYDAPHGHLRLFSTHLGWPATMHSRPMTENTYYWSAGYIRHDRSLDEMMQDYLRYYEAGKGDSGWVAHNQLMMRSACEGTAAIKGWEYVKSFSWWPSVASAAFGGE